MKFFALASILFLFSCTDAKQAKVLGYGRTYTVTVLGPDTVVVFKSSGKVSTEPSSDGYFFEEAETGKRVEVSGTVIVREN